MPFLEFRRVLDRKSTRLNSSHTLISYAVFCLKKKKLTDDNTISSFKYYNYHYSGQTTLGGLAIYKKMVLHTPIDTSGRNLNGPINLFRYYVSANTFPNLSTSLRTGALNYVGRRKPRK